MARPGQDKYEGVNMCKGWREKDSFPQKLRPLLSKCTCCVLIIFSILHLRPDLPFGFWFIGNNSPHSGVVRHRTSRSVGGDAAEEEVLKRELIQALGEMVSWTSLYLEVPGTPPQ